MATSIGIHPKQTDWNLIIQGNISLLWCELCMKKENRAKTVGQLLDEFHKQYAGVDPLNIGTLMMAAYILFVYPQQADFTNIIFSHVVTKNFNVEKGTPKSHKKRFCIRIRNSLAHARFTINYSQMSITLTDQKDDGTDKFETTISIYDFGNFISSFMQEVKDQHFARQSP